MVFKDLHYYGDDFRFHFGNVTVEDGVIVKLEERDAKEAKRERLLLPGMIELHEHGNSGVDFPMTGMMAC